MKVQGKTLIVTGAAHGIGREVALELLRRGARVAAVDIDADALAALAAEVADPRLTPHAVDLTDRAAVEALPAAVIAAHGAVDGCILVAGIIQPFTTLAHLPIEAIERVMNVNFYGPVYLTKALLPLLVERPEAHLVAVSSMGGFVPVPGQTAYGASKAALHLLFDGLHSELMDTAVRVTIVFPGAVGTDIAANSGVHLEMPADAPKIKVLPAPDAATQLLDAMEADRYHAMIGNDARLLDLFTRVAPERAARMVWSQMKNLLASPTPP
jgi:NAD(P)-dependent dehydrogenase (short-subunit alcohol dehydrogenase family)